MKKEKGMKCLVDSFKIFTDEHGFPRSVFVEMDGQYWDSREFDSYKEFLQSIIDHAHNVSIGKEVRV